MTLEPDQWWLAIERGEQMVVVVNFGAPEATIPIEGNLELLFSSGEVRLGDQAVVLGDAACAVVQAHPVDQLGSSSPGEPDAG